MKHVLVTGAYGGMGKSVVDALAKSGYTVFALDKKTHATTLENVIPIQADVTDTQSVDAALQAVRAHTDCLYAVLHFAGIYNLDSLVEIPETDFYRIFQINVFGAYLINKTFLPLLSAGSRILITSSELAPLNPLPFTGIYAVTKTALDCYARSLQMELQLLGISVSVLRPGAVKTDMLGASTTALDRFCENTALYPCNADRFKRIVNGVETRNIPSEKLAKKVLKIVNAKRPKLIYKINRNPLLLLLNVLPKRLQSKIIKAILK